MRFITTIVTIKKYKRKVCLSDGTDFVLYKKEVDTYCLKEEMEISESLYEKLLLEVFIPRAKKRALHLLERMDRSERQLVSKLLEDGYPQEAVEAALDYVKAYHYVDDERLARAYIRFYQDSRSCRRIQQDLMKKGIDSYLIQRCMEEENTTSQMEMIERLLQKRNYDDKQATPQERAKMYRFLLQRGFLTSEIKKAMGNVWDE